MIFRCLFVMSLVMAIILPSACRKPNPDADASSPFAAEIASAKAEADVEIINAGAQGVYFIRPLCRYLKDENYSKAVTEALNLVQNEVRQKYPDSVGKMDFHRVETDMTGIVEDGQQLILDNVGEIGGMGFTVHDLVPNGFIVYFSGPLVYELLDRFAPVIQEKLPGKGSFYAGLVIVPRYVQHYVPGTDEIHSYWTYKIGGTLLAQVRSKSADGNAATPAADTVQPWRVGAGAIWGKLRSPGDLTGFTFGFSGSGAFLKIPYLKSLGNNFKLTFLTNKLLGSDVPTNTLMQAIVEAVRPSHIILSGEAIFSETQYSYLHGYLGLIGTSDLVVQQLGGKSELKGGEVVTRRSHPKATPTAAGG